jgi:RNA polymerase sigma-70 factor (ECF subfamily)
MGWMMRIASRAALAHLRRSPQHDPISEDERQDAAPRPEEVAEQRERVAALGDVLSALPQQQAQCWLLREVGGYSYDEIAEQLDVPVSTVRGALAQARKRILQELGGWR